MDINYSGDIYRKEANIRKDGSRTPEAIQTSVSLPYLSLEVYGPNIPVTLLLAAEAAVDTPFECLAHVRAFRPELISRLRHAVVRRAREVIAILSFYEDGKRLKVVNRLVRLSDDILHECAALLLDLNPAKWSVEFNDLHNGAGEGHAGRARSLTWQSMTCAEAELPGSYDEYLRNFGSTTRKNLRYCARRLERESPAVSFRILRRDEITEEIVASVVELNHRRMTSKGKTSGMDSGYTAHLSALASSHGVACIAADGVRVVGGTLCTRVGNGWTLHVIAHDPQYNHVRLGLLCLLKTIAEAIEGGTRRFNFLWGASDYKVLFGGKISVLRSRRYYRSLGCQLLAVHDVRDCLIQSARRQLASWRARARSSRPMTR